MLKRAIALGSSTAVVAALLTGVLGGPASADSGCPTPSSSLGGGGGVANPYLISSKEDLQEFKDKTSGTDYWKDDVYVEMTANIDMGGCVWSTAIAKTTAYYGKFEGNGFTISGLSVNDTTGPQYVGLFGYAGREAEISNLTFTGNVTGGSSNNVGGLIGGAFNDSAYRNLHVSGTVSGGQYVGGLIGYANTKGVITGSSASGDVTGTGDDVGGLLGYLQNTTATVSNTFATGDVQGASNVGGLVGRYSSGSIATSYASGAVTASSNGGGLVGGNSTATVTNSYWDTDVSVATSRGGTGKTTAELQDISTFSTWSIASGYDASSTWGICSAVNDGFPFLTGAYSADPCSSGGGSGGGGGSLPTSYTLTLEPAEGSICTVASVSGPVNTWVSLPPATSCRPIDDNSQAVLLGWATVRGFPVEIAQRQIDFGMGAYELTDDSGAITGVFIPSGGSAFIVAPNRLYAVWSEPLVVEEVESPESQSVPPVIDAVPA